MQKEKNKNVHVFACYKFSIIAPSPFVRCVVWNPLILSTHASLTNPHWWLQRCLLFLMHSLLVQAVMSMVYVIHTVFIMLIMLSFCFSIFFTVFFLFIMMVFFTSYPLNHLHLARAIQFSDRISSTSEIIYTFLKTQCKILF